MSSLHFTSPQPLLDALQRLWVLSDTHFAHENIVKYHNRPQDHDRLMVKNWKKTVKRHDYILHLGDVTLSAKWTAYMPNLPGQIYLLRGNHDKQQYCESFRHAGWRLVEPFTAEYRDWQIKFTHQPLTLGARDARVINVHGHIHSAPPPSERHINVSVERIDYTPVLLKDLLDQKIDELTHPQKRLRVAPEVL